MKETQANQTSNKIRRSKLVISHDTAKKTSEKSNKRIGIFPIEDMNSVMNMSSCITRPSSKSPTLKVPVIRQSKKRLKFDDIQNMLLGKSGTEDIDLTDFRKLSFNYNAASENEEASKNRVWNQMLKYTKGDQMDGKLNHFILIQNIKKLIIEAIKKTKPHHEMFLENYNIYKSFCFQTLVLPLLHSKRSKEEDKKIKLLVEIISDSSFHQSLKLKFEDHKSNYNNDSVTNKASETHEELLMTPKFKNPLILPESQKLIPELPIQIHEDKYSYVKSKVKAAASPIYTLKSKKQKRRNKNRIDMGLLTYLNDNKKKHSFSSDGSSSSRENNRHHNIVLNINNVFNQNTINQNLSPHINSIRSLQHEDRMDIENKSPKMFGGSSKLMSPLTITEEHNMSYLNEKSDESSRNLSRSSNKSHTREKSTKSRLQRLFIHNKSKDGKRYEKKVTRTIFHNIPPIKFRPNMRTKTRMFSQDDRSPHLMSIKTNTNKKPDKEFVSKIIKKPLHFEKMTNKKFGRKALSPQQTLRYADQIHLSSLKKGKMSILSTGFKFNQMLFSN